MPIGIFKLTNIRAASTKNQTEHDADGDPLGKYASDNATCGLDGFLGRGVSIHGQSVGLFGQGLVIVASGNGIHLLRGER